MTKAAYMQQRAPYRRPQAILWADNSGTLVAYPSSINAVTNSNFETNTTGWTALGGSTIARSTATYVYGSASLLLTTAAGGTNPGINNDSYRIAVEAGQTYTLSAYVKDVSTNGNWCVSILFYDAATGGNTVGTEQLSNTVVPGTSAWTRISKTATAPTGATYAQIYVKQIIASTLVGKQAYIDAILFQEGSDLNTYVDGTTSARYFYAPTGYDYFDATAGDNFLILSDHNRGNLDFKPQRIEKRQRMINGRMRSYHVADKMTLSTSWNKLPSRSYSTDPQFNAASGLPTVTTTWTGTTNGIDTTEKQYTVDGGAGGADLLKWYEDHQGPFWVYLGYDKPQNFTTDRYNHLDQYNEIIQMYISDFSYTVEKRGGGTFDLWTVNVTLEEV